MAPVGIRKMLDYVGPVPTDIALNLIDAVIKNDLLGLVVRIMALLKPGIGASVGSEQGKYRNEFVVFS